MSPQLKAAYDRVIERGAKMLLLTLEDSSYKAGHPHFEADHAELKQLIRERDDIALDESTLTPECIGQLMGGN